MQNVTFAVNVTKSTRNMNKTKTDKCQETKPKELALLRKCKLRLADLKSKSAPARKDVFVGGHMLREFTPIHA